MTATCTICSNRAARDLVDGALLSGDRVAHVWHEYGPGLPNISLSALYRHARAHLPTQNFGAPYIADDESVADLITAQVRILRNIISIHEQAVARGDTSAAIRTAAEARSTLELLMGRLGIDGEDITKRLDGLDRLVKGIREATKIAPSFAQSLADSLRQIGDDESASEVEGLKQYVINQKKELAK